MITLKEKSSMLGVVEDVDSDLVPGYRDEREGRWPAAWCLEKRKNNRLFRFFIFFCSWLRFLYLLKSLISSILFYVTLSL